MISQTTMRKIDVNQLPQFSNWPARLLRLEEFKQRTKSKEEIDREFEREKWGRLLAQIEQCPSIWDLEKADRFFLAEGETVLSLNNDLYVASEREAHEVYLAEIGRRLGEFLPLSSVAELGAGYGSTVLGLAKRGVFSTAGIFAAEYTEAGIACLKHLSVAEGVSLEVGPCDFSQTCICRMNIPARSLIYTCSAVTYLTALADTFIDSLLDLKPSVVVHFEPCMEHYDNTLLGRLRESYVKINDYNQTLMSFLRRRAFHGDIRIVREERCFVGENCLLPVSCVAWSPS